MRVKIYRSIKLFTCILTRCLYIYFVFFISDNHFKYEFILSQRFIFLDDDDNDEEDDDDEDDEDLTDEEAEQAMKEKLVKDNSKQHSFKNELKYSADEKIRLNLKNNTTSLHENAQIHYDKTNIHAHHIDLNIKKSLIKAYGKKNKKKLYYSPRVFINVDKYLIFADEMKYNFDSQRGKFVNILAILDQGMIFRSNVLKKDIKDTYYCEDIFLTSCNLPRPHYGILIKRGKFKHKKGLIGEKAYLCFDGIKTPAGILFGLYLFPLDKRSGFIFPSFKEEKYKGFGLINGGYYFYFNDYIDLALTTSLYTRGSTTFQAESNYIKRYAYSGHLSYQFNLFSKYSSGNHFASTPKTSSDWILKWQHKTLYSKIWSLTIDIDLHNTSPEENSLISSNDKEKDKKTFRSSINYTRQKLFYGLYNLNATIDLNQDWSTKIMTMSLPKMSLSSISMKPFKVKRGAKYINGISLKHNVEGILQLSNEKKGDGKVADPYAVKKPKEPEKERSFEFSWKNKKQIFENMKYGIKHGVTLDNNIQIFSYFNLHPYINYTERWYFQRYDYKESTSNPKLERRLLPYRVWDWNTGTDLSTTIYGLFHFNENAKISALRLKIDPTIGFKFTPEFGDNDSFYQKINGNKYNRFNGAVYGNAPDHKSAVVTLKCDNILESKIRNNGKKEVVTLIDSFGFDTGYDLIAPQFGMQNINYNVKTHVGFVNIEYQATLDPYYHEKVNGSKQRINEFTWNHNQGLGNITSSSWNISTSFKSNYAEKKEKQMQRLQDKMNGKKNNNEEEEDLSVEEDDELTEDDYAYFYPIRTWTLGVGFRRSYTFDIDTDVTKTTHQMNFNTSFDLTKSWKFNSGIVYDLDKMNLKYKDVNFGLTGDLHCWIMTFSMTPFGKTISYSFMIGIKGGMLQDIKIPHSNSYNRY